MKLPKRIAALLTVTLVASSSANLGYVNAAEGVSSEVLKGAGRWETAIEVSQKGWSSATEAIIVNDASIADALAATPFADAKNAPILLTGKDSLNEKTKAELKRLGVKKVYIIGGENTLTKNVEDLLKAEKLEVDRIYGNTRELTALEIAKRLDEIKPISEIAVVNSTKGLPDAVSIAATAADKDMAIILSNTNEGTKASDEFIKSKDIKTSYVIGGVNSVSEDVKNKLPNAKRIGGKDRNETNAEVLKTFYTERDINNAYVAKDGMGKEDQLIDALSVGVLAAKNDSPVIIVGNKLNQIQKDVTNTKSFKTVTQVGGRGNETAFNELKTMQGVTTYEVKTVAELNDALAKADANDVINVISLSDNKRSNNTISFESDNAIYINLYDNNKSYIVNMGNGVFVVHGNHSSIDIENANLVIIKGTVGTVNVLKNGDVSINNEGNSKPNVTVAEGASAKVDGKISTITVSGEDASVSIEKDAVVGKVEVSKEATGAVIENAGKVDKVESNAPNVSIDNSGTVGAVGGTNKPTVEGNPVTSPSGGGGGGGYVPSPPVTDQLNAWDGTTKTEVTPNNDGVYEVNKASELAWISDFVNQGNTNIKIRLMANIDLGNKEWTPIGSEEHPFSGVFDGDEKIIKNLKIEKADLDNVGLFGKATRGVVLTDITIEKANIIGNSNIGTLVGHVFGSGTISNCDIKEATVKAELKNVGGIVGSGYVNVSDCELNNVKVEAERVENEGDNVGGVIGYLADAASTIERITLNDINLSGERKVGGVAGSANFATIVFDDCEVTGDSIIDVTGSKASNSFAGGIVGEAIVAGITIKNCSVDTTVTIKGNNNNKLGWFVGGSRASTSDVLTDGIVTFEGSDCNFEDNFLPWDGKTLTSASQAADEYYQVYTPSQLAWIANFVNQGNTNIKIRLMSNIDLNNEEWIPIGNQNSRFAGTFDGDNKIIKNLSINKSNENYLGLFGYGENAILKNVTIDNVNISGNEFVGTLIGRISSQKNTTGTIEISNCIVNTAKIKGLSYIGGIVGHGAVDIDGCKVNGLIATAYDQSGKDGDDVGGIIGYMPTGIYTISNSTVSNINLKGLREVGCIVGTVGESGKVIDKCSVEGTNSIEIIGTIADSEKEEGNTPCAGGILGKATGNSNVTIKECTVEYNKLTITGVEDIKVGLLIGAVEDQNGYKLIGYDDVSVGNFMLVGHIPNLNPNIDVDLSIKNNI